MIMARINTIQYKFINIIIYIIFTSHSSSVIANEFVNDELSTLQAFVFNPNSLFGGNSQSVNLDAFTYSNAFTSGLYNVELYVNDRAMGNLTVSFHQLKDNDSLELCVDQDLLDALNIKNNILEKIPSKNCYSIKDFDSDAFYDFNHNDLKLNLSIPLAIMEYQPDGYIPMEKFDKGINSAFVVYDVNANTIKFDEGNSTKHLFLNLKGGLNWNGFNFRHAGSFSTNEFQLNKYQSFFNTVSTDILPIQSRLTIGDFFTQTYDISSANIRGIQLATDISMRPTSQQNYAPVIQGIAQTNAIVSIFQNGQKIYERNVPIGNFTIQDLNTISTGDLTVQITETNGQKSSFIVPNQGSFNLIRLNQFNYTFALGRYNLNQQLTNDYLAQFSFEYGLTNFISIVAGSNISKPFQNYLLGLSTNTKYGGLKFSIDSAHAELLDQQFNGYKYRTSYYYNLNKLNTIFTINALYQTQNYMDLNNTISLKNYEYLSDAEIDNFFRTYLLKQQFDISIYQPFSKNYGGLYFNANRSKYWNSNETYSQYQLGYSNSYKNLSYSLGFVKTYNLFNSKNDENRFYLNLSIPLDWKKKTAFVHSNIQHSNHPNNQVTATIGSSMIFGDQSQGQVGLNHNYISDSYKDQNTISANLGYNFPQAHLSTNASWSKDFYQYGLSSTGGLVLHRYGLTATNNIPDTYTIIHAKGIPKANIINGWGVKTDSFGNAIFSNISPYRPNEISVDISNLPLNIQPIENQKSIVPRRYSSTLINIDIKKSSNMLLELSTPNNILIPIGLHVKNKNDKFIGSFGQSNQLFIENSELLDHELLITWGNESTQNCKIQLPKNIQELKLNIKDSFLIIPVECQ